MAGLIPQTFIDDLLDRIDIVDVIDSRVKLKKSGKNYSACCPFHDEKTPSFTVSPDKQFYYCFGCGASGTALGFVLDYDRLSFPDGVEELAKMAGLEVPREARNESPQYLAQQQLRKNLYDTLNKADLHYRHQLRTNPARQHAVNYLQKRGLSGEIARDFGLGYAAPGWDNLLQTLGQSDQQKQLLTEGGLLIERPEDGRRYDRFRNRIMFPILDIRGRVIAFGGRVLDDSKPKYLNSPETPIFHKGKELYGLYQAKQAHSQLPRLLVVEGYMDVVALAQFGIRYAVATLGTANGEDHLTLAFKHTQEVVFCFDGDSAGRKAAIRALENSLPVMQDGRQIKFLFLPEGEDPDTLIRQVGAEKFSRMIETAVPLEEFLFDSVADGIDIQSMEGRARLSKRAAPLLHKLPAGVFRELMFANLAQRTGLPIDTLLELVDNTEEVITQAQEYQPQARASEPLTNIAPEMPLEDTYDNTPLPIDIEATANLPNRPTQPKQYSGPIKLTPAKRLSAILLQHPELASNTPDNINFANSRDADLSLFQELLELLKSRPNYNLPRILGHWRGTKGADATSRLAELAATELLNQARMHTPFDAAGEYYDCLRGAQQQITKQHQNSQLQALSQKSFSDLSDQEKQKIRDLHLRGTDNSG